VIDRVEHLSAIPSNLFGLGIAWGFPLREAGFLKACAGAFAPLGGDLLAEPVGGHDSKSVQRRAECFAHPFQAVARPDRRKHMGRIRTRMAASLQEATHYRVGGVWN
jgi:hypothetical protein